MARQFETIASFQNPKLKQIKRLRNKRDREREQRFVIDDRRDLARALNCDYQVDYVLYCPSLTDGDDSELIERLDDSAIYEVPIQIIEKVSYRQNPSSILAVLHQKPRKGADRFDEISDGPILTLVDLKKPGNIGALLRTADATGFKIIFLVDTALDLMNPNIIRSSTGACFLDNVYIVNSDEASGFFTSRGYSVVSAIVEGDTSLFDVTLHGNITIVLGTEDRGLSEFWQKNADQRISIPMMGNLSDSLNVSVSGAVMMYEALRQGRFQR
jgi:TrmH family RNA methyltransferase